MEVDNVNDVEDIEHSVQDSMIDEEQEVEVNEDVRIESTEIDSEIINSEKDEADNLPKKNKKEEIVRYRPLHLPLARIKQIVKMDPDVSLAGSDAVFLIAKATELFIELLSKDSYTLTVSAKKKTIQKKDVDAAIRNTDALVFLDGAMET